MTTVGFARAVCGAAACAMAAALFVGAETAADVSLFPPPFDKIVHFAYYGVMAALLAHAVGVRWLWLPVLLVPMVGAADEWHQASVAGRYASAWDWIADVMGAAIFVYGYWKWAKKRGLEARPR